MVKRMGSYPTMLFLSFDPQFTPVEAHDQACYSPNVVQSYSKASNTKGIIVTIFQFSERGRMENRAEQALKSWQEAKLLWTQGVTRPELCHPWSETDYLVRLKSFEGYFELRDSQRLASEGFQRLDDGTIICQTCKADFSKDSEHKLLCPWRGRFFAALKSSWHIEHSPSDTLYDHCRHALGAMEDVRSAMRSISTPRNHG